MVSDLFSPDLHRHLKEHGQEHVLSGWEALGPDGRAALVQQLERLDLAQLRQLHGRRGQADVLPPRDKIAPAPVIPHDAPENEERRRLGEEALRRGEVAALVVAGGQGTRLGFDAPKGAYPIGPVSAKPLFQVHAEKVLARGRRAGRPLPFLVMTSHATHADTVAFFEEKGFFGLPRDQVFFFQQGTMPALDFETGRLLLEAPGRLALSPDGHGGTLTALRKSGLLDELRGRGVRHLFYFQVDNPLVQVADPVFLGHHLAHAAEASSKAVAKRGPAEKMGVFAAVDGRCTIIEYSDLPEDLARQTDARGRLVLWAGSPAIHVFDLDFLARVTEGAGRLPFHVAKKKVAHVEPSGRPVEPEAPNALKFERFIFDVLPMAERWTVVEALREDEFAPVKNADGDDSPATARQALSDQAARWLTQAGARVPRRADGAAAVALEVSPLFALDAPELAAKLKPGAVVDGSHYFE